MRRWLHLLSVLTILAPSFALGAQGPDSGSCYDLALVGYIGDESNNVNLNDILPPKPNSLYLAERVDVLIHVSKVFVGDNVPTYIWSRTILGAMPRSTTPVLFFLHRFYGSLYRTVWLDIPAKRDWFGRFMFPVASSEFPSRCE
jgi:hypothetical protein